VAHAAKRRDARARRPGLFAIRRGGRTNEGLANACAMKASRARRDGGMRVALDNTPRAGRADEEAAHARAHARRRRTPRRAALAALREATRLGALGEALAWRARRPTSAFPPRGGGGPGDAPRAGARPADDRDRLARPRPTEQARAQARSSTGAPRFLPGRKGDEATTTARGPRAPRADECGHGVRRRAQGAGPRRPKGNLIGLLRWRTELAARRRARAFAVSRTRARGLRSTDSSSP